MTEPDDTRPIRERQLGDHYIDKRFAWMKLEEGVSAQILSKPRPSRERSNENQPPEKK